MIKVKKILLLLMFVVLLLSSNNVFAKVTGDDLATKNQKERLILLYNANDIEETLKAISKIPENERDSEIWFMLANLTQDAGEEEDAIFYLQKSILTDKTNDKAYYNLGNIYLGRSQYYYAIKMYKNAIRYKNDFAPYYYNLGCAYFAVQDFSNAKKYFYKAVIINNSEPRYRYNLALAYKKLGNIKKAQQELDIYNKLMQE